MDGPLIKDCCPHAISCYQRGCNADCVSAFNQYQELALRPPPPFIMETAAASATKDTNPKQALGTAKLPLHLVPATAIALASLAHLDGALRYGTANWRIAGVRVSTYVSAAKRHLDKWFNGEEFDADSGVPHLAHVLACVNIIVDAHACGKLNDDRPPRAPIGDWFAALTPHVKRLNEKNKDAAPRHYTIEDSEQ